MFENFTYDPGRGVVCESFILTVVMEKQGLVIDAGMGVNYFDDQLVRGPSETDDAESSS